jgi:hypothetical protein
MPLTGGMEVGNEPSLTPDGGHVSTLDCARSGTPETGDLAPDDRQARWV